MVDELNHRVKNTLATVMAIAAQTKRTVIIGGGEVRLGPIAAVTLGMALNELASNAAQYGALSTPAGRVRVAWGPGAPGRLRLDWEESGGPPVEAPSRSGFGSALIQKVLAAELRGEVRLEFPRRGVRCTMDMALDRVSAH
jgi:two-component sensor histidine kinase